MSSSEESDERSETLSSEQSESGSENESEEVQEDEPEIEKPELDPRTSAQLRIENQNKIESLK